jgi:hypothetical protein
VVVEDLQPGLRLVLAPGDDRLLDLGILALEVREELRVDQAIAPVAVEVRIEPVHDLVNARALLEVLGIGGRADLFGEVAQDRGAFGEPEAVVIQHRDEMVGIELAVRRFVVLTFEDVDHLHVALDVVVGDELHHRTRRCGNRMHVELHGVLPEGRDPSMVR